jgi:hypothetical protein
MKEPARRRLLQILFDDFGRPLECLSGILSKLRAGAALAKQIP